MSESIFTGYDPELEDVGKLLKGAQPWQKQCRGEAGEPEYFDPRDWLQIENQGSWPSCGGHALSTTLEIAYYFATGGDVTQLSRHFAWVEAQRVHGRPSSRNGVSIYACAKVAQEIGLPPEEKAPYKVGNWYTKFTDDVYTAAKPFRAIHKYTLEDYDDCLDFLKSGGGAIINGLPWDFNTRAWHATCWGGFLSDGRLLCVNSWGNWSQDGCIEHDERTVNKYLGYRGSVAIGLSDMEVPGKRSYPWKKELLG